MAPTTIGTRFSWATAVWVLLGMIIVAAAGRWLLSSGGTVGTLEIHVKDHREAIDDFARLELGIKKIRIGSRPGVNSQQFVWRNLTPQVFSLDLTKLTGDQMLRLFRGELETGTFEAIHLDLNQVLGTLKTNRRVVPVENRVSPIRIAFSIDPRTDSRIVLDLVVLDISDHPPSGYELHIKGYELYKGGRLIDKVPPG